MYCLSAFMIFLIIVFLAVFINLYSQRLQENRANIYMRNQYVVSILFDNINLRRQLLTMADKYPVLFDEEHFPINSKDIDDVQQELSKEQRLNEELQRNYDNNYEAIITGAEIVCIGILLVILFIFMLLMLLNYWVITPLEKLKNISDKVSEGIFSSRLPHKDRRFFRDEFDILFAAFNQMLDNTENNIEEAKIRELFLQHLIDSLPDGIRVIDKDYNTIMANKSFYDMLHIKNNIIGKKCFQAYGFNCDGCPQSRYNCPLRYIRDEKKDHLSTIHEIGKKPVYVNAVKLRRGANADDYYIIESLHDLSRDVRFSHQQKVSSLGFLSTSIAHEMKNNLGAIRLILEGILDSEYKDIDDCDERKKYLLMAYNQLVETVKIPERLLRLAQYSENDVVSIDVGAAVKDMMLMIDYDAKRRGIVTVVDIEPNLSVIANESDFKMIILNLVQNAVKAMPDGGELRVSGEKNNRMVVINIKDTGIGINEEQLKHIFEPFYSASKQAKSYGLGLAIVNSLIEKARGSMSVKSKPGKGTRFTVRFPIDAKSD